MGDKGLFVVRTGLNDFENISRGKRFFVRLDVGFLDTNLCLLGVGFKPTEKKLDEGVIEGVLKPTENGLDEGVIEGVLNPNENGLDEGVIEGVIEGVLNPNENGLDEGVIEGVIEGVLKTQMKTAYLHR